MLSKRGWSCTRLRDDVVKHRDASRLDLSLNLKVDEKVTIVTY